MSLLPKLAWKNLWRRKRRTLITMSSVAFGVWFTATFVGICNHTYTELIDGSVRMGFGHVSIEPVGYNISPSLDKRLPNAESLAETTRALSGVTAAIARISGPAVISTASGSVPGMLLGIDPAKESASMNAYLASIREGKVFESAAGRGAVLGSVLAQRLRLKLGSKIVYTAIDVNGEMISETARVEGIFKTGVDDVDGAAVLLPIDALRKSLKYGPGEVTMISVYLDDHRRSEKVAGLLRENTTNAEVHTWKDTQPGVASYIALDGSMSDVFLALIVLVIAAGVLNTMVMSVLERKRELGVMLAIGTSPSVLFRLIVCEASILAVIGFIAGAIIFVPWMFYMQQVGIDLTSVVGSDMQVSGVLYDPIIHIALRPEDASVIMLSLFTLVLATAAYPAYRAARLPPIESMR
jgi:ABC-type lipoprotein release transport system permease subunit